LRCCGTMFRYGGSFTCLPYCSLTFLLNGLIWSCLDPSHRLCSCPFVVVILKYPLLQACMTTVCICVLPVNIIDTPRRKQHLRSGRSDFYVCVRIWLTRYVYTEGSSWNLSSNTLELYWLQHDCPADCVIAQQYSSTTFDSLRFCSRKEKNCAFSKMLFQGFKCLKKNCVSLKLRSRRVSVQPNNLLSR
jgi:hypothetical protein